MTTKTLRIWTNYSQIDSASDSEKNLQWCARNVPKLPKISFSWTKKEVNKKDSDLKNKEKEKNKLLPNRFGNWFRKKTPICAKIGTKRPKVLLFKPKKKVKQKDSEYKISSLVGQMDCKNTKEKSDLLNSTHSEKILQYLL